MTSLVGLVTAVGCGHGPGGEQPQGGQHTGIGVVDTASVSDLFNAIGKAGLPAPNPRDVTDRDCPQIGCLKKVETDTVSIMRFPTPGSAQVYAGGAGHVYQIVDVVLSFSRFVSPDDEPAYERAVAQVIE